MRRVRVCAPVCAHMPQTKGEGMLLHFLKMIWLLCAQHAVERIRMETGGPVWGSGNSQGERECESEFTSHG